MVIPYTDNSAHIKDDLCTLKRLKYTIDFVNDPCGKTLDIGDVNFVGEKLSERCSSSLDNTSTSDFNDEVIASRSDYDTVFCFEVIEHVMNPLNFLRNIHLLLRPDGVLYLSTPVRNKYGFMFNESCHFTEYSVNSIKTVVEYAGFKILKHKTFRSIPFWWGMLKGGGLFRTSLRVLSQRTQILKAVKV